MIITCCLFKRHPRTSKVLFIILIKHKIFVVVQPVFYVSDDEMSVHSKLDELDEVDDADFATATTFGNIDDSNGSLNGRFDRELGFNVKSNRCLASVGRSHKTRRKDGGRRRSKSRSRRLEEEEMQVSQMKSLIDIYLMFHFPCKMNIKSVT